MTQNPFESAYAPLPRGFYDRPTIDVGRDLLGKLLFHCTGRQPRVARIVEVEAYLGPHDKAAHSARGLTARTRIMFGPPGHAYVYLIYGVYHCFNVVTESVGSGSAVLIRAVQPLHGIASGTRGPGLLCRAMDIDLRHNGIDLTGDSLFIAADPAATAFKTVASARIGVDYAGAWARRLLRFHIKDNPHVSRRR